MNKFIYLLFFLSIFCIYFISFFNKNLFIPFDLSNKHVCINDGMILIDYKGPKAQILWKDGSTNFYCDVRESFYEWVDPIKRKRIKKFFVQDFSFVKWGSYSSNWVESINAVYVIDSVKYGAMGISYIPFTDVVYAKLFMNKYGGIIVNFEDIILDVLDKSNEILKDRMINNCKIL